MIQRDALSRFSHARLSVRNANKSISFCDIELKICTGLFVLKKLSNNWNGQWRITIAYT